MFVKLITQCLLVKAMHLYRGRVYISNRDML